ncbi:hypothetical protein JOF53_007106 [Crossiella equi]|uniref:Uncharacterized protein n=1 Tax=Crossiella equi TaxID=130796 RepID=A0ABS5ANR4_9PSEU|nr:hypothetical protein [Crossiella equi]MBP2478234.1 hypothetical protein [Crossiella equi]
MNTSKRIIAGAVVSALLLTGSASLANAAQAGPSTVATTAEGTADQRGVIGAIIKAIKKFGPSVWNKCVAAVKGGYQAFKKWYDDLPAPVRWAIRAASAGWTLYDIYLALREVIG